MSCPVKALRLSGDCWHAPDDLGHGFGSTCGPEAQFSGVPINLKRNQGKTKFGFLLFELIAEYIREDTHGGACMTGIADALSGGAC